MLNAINIHSLYAGKFHSYIQANDQFIGFGLDQKGRIGMGSAEDAILPPKIIPLFSVKRVLLNIF